MTNLPSQQTKEQQALAILHAGLVEIRGGGVYPAVVASFAHAILQRAGQILSGADAAPVPAPFEASSADDAFELQVIELLGPQALAGGQLSMYEVARMFWNAGIGYQRNALGLGLTSSPPKAAAFQQEPHNAP